MKQLLLIVSPHLYEKIKKYKDDNEFPSILSVIRYILNQFFKQQSNQK